MNQKQFSDRIGNIDDRLVQQAEQVPNYARQHRRNNWRKIVGMAAAIALMVCSGIVGAVAFGSEPQETIELDEIGLTLILPDDWEGKYEVTKSESNSYVVYSPEIKTAWGGSEDPFDGGVLFYVVRIDDVLTSDQVKDSEWNYAANRYLFATEDCTYLLYYASDVQFPLDMEEEYRQMEAGIKDIRIIADSLLADKE